MKNRTKKLLAAGMILIMMFTFAACGGQPTLEEYINDNAEAKEMLDAAGGSDESGDVKVTVEENTIIYSFKVPETVEGDVKDQISKALAEYMEVASTFEQIASSMEEQSGIDGISVRVTYLNGDDSELFSKEYQAAESTDAE